MRAAIIGLGVVGHAQARLFGDMVHVTFDPKMKRRYPYERVAECDFAVVCVGTPQAKDGTADLSFVREALDRIPPEFPVLIRSTIPPGTMAGLEKTRGCVAHMPEFLNERPDGDWKDSRDVPFVILGGKRPAREFFMPALATAYKWPMTDIGFWPPVLECTVTEAELIKYMANCFLAAKVTFVNEMARICDAFGADWDRVRAGWQCDPRAGQSHSRVEGPGFGGRCLPKDLSALIKASEGAGYMPEFLWALEEANARFQDSGAAS